jgi:cysteinyl-tRNA synthetase
MLQILKEILGLDCIVHQDEKIHLSDEILELLKERDKARAQKNFKRADEIRALLISKGISLNDGKI